MNIFLDKKDIYFLILFLKNNKLGISETFLYLSFGKKFTINRANNMSISYLKYF